MLVLTHYVSLIVILFFFPGHTGSSGLTGAYIPSFLKKEVGSAGQRAQLAPVIDPTPTDLSSRKFCLGFLDVTVMCGTTATTLESKSPSISVVSSQFPGSGHCWGQRVFHLPSPVLDSQKRGGAPHKSLQSSLSLKKCFKIVIVTFGFQ